MKQLVGWCRNAVYPAEEHGLAIEVVGLDVADGAPQELVAARAPRRVLELAAGTGILTAELARLLLDARIPATDLNPEMVSWAAHRVANVDWRQADAQRLDYPRPRSTWSSASSG